MSLHKIAFAPFAAAARFTSSLVFTVLQSLKNYSTNKDFMSQITTHILDTHLGRPAEGITIALLRGENDEWTEIARGVTNTDGRITNLLKNNILLTRGIYMLRFATKDYFDKRQVPTFCFPVNLSPRCGGTGITLVAPSERNIPVPPRATLVI